MGYDLTLVQVRLLAISHQERKWLGMPITKALFFACRCTMCFQGPDTYWLVEYGSFVTIVIFNSLT